jgi:hypothetical protein
MAHPTLLEQTDDREAHRYSDWYINPGESDEAIAAKRESAAAAITGD